MGGSPARYSRPRVVHPYASTVMIITRCPGSRPEAHHVQNWLSKGEWTDTVSPVSPQATSRPISTDIPHDSHPRTKTALSTYRDAFCFSALRNEASSATVICRHSVPSELRCDYETNHPINR